MDAKLWEFQSTHPHGVRLGGLHNDPQIIDRFNPRTRTGCDYAAARVHEGTCWEAISWA